ncbi:glycoside hydrolase family 19 protein [Cupriavidus sp. WS]|uniref:glycoside hydrolase family 19 protein n=1 Tax=Cupriavidus sp. WS TaxID=1312922 RepID=UPI000380D6BF|nr:glycoside hydrolase family 19 protein [Cupriavidus sp. WS]
MITPAILHAIMPGAGRRADVFALPLGDAAQRFGIDTPARVAAWLAQVAHESGQLIYTREIWGPTPTQMRYEGRADLGNTQPGDGKRFMGRGLIQITGRKNYLLCGLGLHLDLLSMPALLEQPDAAAASAGWYWQAHGLDRFVDAGDFIGLTRAINGSTNGLADRQQFWARAKAALGVKA